MLRISSRLTRVCSRNSLRSTSTLFKLGAQTQLLALPEPAPLAAESSASSSEGSQAAAGALLASLALGAVGAALGLHIVHADEPEAKRRKRMPSAAAAAAAADVAAGFAGVGVSADALVGGATSNIGVPRARIGRGKTVVPAECAPLYFGEIKRGAEFFAGAAMEAVHTVTTFAAAVSPMNVMFHVDESGTLIQDMRPRFLHELLTLGVLNPNPGYKGDGYAKFYRADMTVDTVARLRTRAAKDPNGPVARYLTYREVIDATIKRSSHVNDFLRVDPEDAGADNRHGDVLLSKQERIDGGRTRLITKNSSSSNAVWAATEFRQYDANKGGKYLDQYGETFATVLSSGAGASYGGNAVTMGAAQIGPNRWVQHKPLARIVQKAQGAAGQAIWTVSAVTDYVTMTPADQRRYVKAHQQLMKRFNITPAMASQAWVFTPPRVSAVVLRAPPARPAADGANDASHSGGAGLLCDKPCPYWDGKTPEDQANMTVARNSSKELSVAMVAPALVGVAPFFGSVDEARKALYGANGKAASALKNASETIWLVQNPGEDLPKRPNLAHDVDWKARGNTPQKRDLAGQLRAIPHPGKGGGAKGNRNAAKHGDEQLRQEAAKKAGAGEEPSLPDGTHLQCVRAADGSTCGTTVPAPTFEFSETLGKFCFDCQQCPNSKGCKVDGGAARGVVRIVDANGTRVPDVDLPFPIINFVAASKLRKARRTAAEEAAATTGAD